MPIYEYKCEKCGKIISVFQRGLKQEELLLCPDCGSANLTRLLSTPAMVRVGNGSPKGTTCCGREERCETPPCSENGICRRDKR